MFGITLGLLTCLLVGFLLWRFVFPRASTMKQLLGMVILSGGLCLFLAGLALLAWRVKVYNQGVISAEPLQSAAALATHQNRDTIVVGRISEINFDIPGTPYVAYRRWPANEDPERSDFEYELPDLHLTVGDEGFIEVDGLAYDSINWPREKTVSYVYEFIDQGDEVVIAGELYEGGIRGHTGLYLAPTFVFAGDYEMFSAEYAPTLQRTASYAQIVQYITLVAAALILISPLPQAIHLRNTGGAKG